MVLIKIQVIRWCYTVLTGKQLPSFREAWCLHLQGHTVFESRACFWTNERFSTLIFYLRSGQLVQTWNNTACKTSKTKNYIQFKMFQAPNIYNVKLKRLYLQPC